MSIASPVAARPWAERADRPTAECDGAAGLFVEHGVRLRDAVRGTVGTSEANVEDACAFAWLQLVRRRPQRDTRTTVFPWLLRTAVREAVKLDRHTRRAANLEQLAGAVGDFGPKRHRLGAPSPPVLMGDLIGVGKLGVKHEKVAVRDVEFHAATGAPEARLQPGVDGTWV
jgi:DNA-directed RNA polymerase specialized sigma24 family protein